MAQTITNQASLDYRYNGQETSTLSNIASAVLTDPLTLEKHSIESTYRENSIVTFVVSFTNSSASALTNVTVSDDLGTYTPGTNPVTPLTFVPSALLYVNGVYNGTITPDYRVNRIVFTLATLAAGANAQILYKTLVNSAAPLITGSTITNTVTIDADGLTSSVQASSTVNVSDYADVKITKCMAPATVVDGAAMMYSFTVYNYGNAAATNLVLRDSFNPAPSGITVQVDGTIVPSANYSYENGVLTLPAGSAYTLSLPAATIAQESSGVVSVTPSAMTITVTGTL